ncbi:unnamed protein product [Peniophora sp. CBMAI 1063]|nr:unnamed protein product [Peniophora sp. CBMAI 1063]
MIATAILLLSLSLSASAAPSRRQSGDNGSCQALQTECAATVKSDLSDAWNIKACLFGASCFGGQHPVDGFLAAVYGDRGESGSAPASVDLPRVTSSLFNSISTDGQTVSQQNFIDGYYSALDATGGPYPTDVSYVIDLFGRVQGWTAFCSESVPFQNFADYYQYSSSVNSAGCSAAAKREVAAATTSAAPAAATTPVVSSDASCQKMFTACIDQVDQDVANPWAVEACVLGATCFGGQVPVDGFLSTVYSQKNPSSTVTAPTSINEPRLATSLFASVSTDGQTWTQQNFIDAYYGTLSSVGGPFPANSDLVISYFDRVLEWTAFCPGQGIPYMNVADYFQYSATVQGGSAQCN